MLAFSTFQKAMYMQMKMLIGDFSILEDTQESPWVVPYCMLFMVLVFLTLMNFFLAIVVDGFMVVKASIKDDEAESNFPLDFVLSIVRLIDTWRGFSPHPKALRFYTFLELEEKLSISQKSEIEIQVLGESRVANAVTAEELFHCVRGRDDEPLFKSVERARSFLLTYARRFPHFLEKDLDLCFKEGDHMELQVTRLPSVSSNPSRSSLMGTVLRLETPKRVKKRHGITDLLASEDNEGEEDVQSEEANETDICTI